ncbi:MAG TPA: hypothetical protein DCQ98_00150 [Planctomycetaceae bacterium]|nr:hypothetical protein [Planctomycetaceae bacterium]
MTKALEAARRSPSPRQCSRVRRNEAASVDVRTSMAFRAKTAERTSRTTTPAVHAEDAARSTSIRLAFRTCGAVAT